MPFVIMAASFRLRWLLFRALVELPVAYVLEVAAERASVPCLHRLTAGVFARSGSTEYDAVEIGVGSATL